MNNISWRSSSQVIGAASPSTNLTLATLKAPRIVALGLPRSTQRKVSNGRVVSPTDNTCEVTTGMEVTYQRCCGIDVHKKTLTACVVTPETQQTRTFSTMTTELLLLADWLSEHKVTHVAMESTGVYWKPVYNLLEDDFAVMVVNARHIKAVRVERPM